MDILQMVNGVSIWRKAPKMAGQPLKLAEWKSR